MADFALLESPKLISRKISVIEKSWNLHIVLHQLACNFHAKTIRESKIRIIGNTVSLAAKNFKKWRRVLHFCLQRPKKRSFEYIHSRRYQRHFIMVTDLPLWRNQNPTSMRYLWSQIQKYTALYSMYGQRYRNFNFVSWNGILHLSRVCGKLCSFVCV